MSDERATLARSRRRRPRRSQYQSGFGNGFETEALPGALPVGPQFAAEMRLRALRRAAERLALHRAAASNERSWLYRIMPTVTHWGQFSKADAGLWRTAPCAETEMPIAPLRWDPMAIPNEKLSFVQGVRTITTAGDRATQSGMAAHIYLITRSMQDEYFWNADGEMLFVLQQGDLRFWTEFGIIDAEPGEIVLIPRGVKLRLELKGEPARGYMCENYGGAFTLPERGPIGANCLANPRDFLTPVAAYEDKQRAIEALREVGRVAMGDRSRSFAARCGRVAWQLRAVQIRPAPFLAGGSAAVRPR